VENIDIKEKQTLEKKGKERVQMMIY